MIDAAVSGFQQVAGGDAARATRSRPTGWIIPTLQTIHILGVAVVFSSAVLVDLRLWRLLQRDVPLPEVARRFLPVIWPVLLMLLITGSLLIIGEPRRSLLNTTFYLKMALLAVAMLLTVALQWSLSAAPQFWDKDRGAADRRHGSRRPSRSWSGAASCLPDAGSPTRRSDDAAARGI